MQLSPMELLLGSTTPSVAAWVLRFTVAALWNAIIIQLNYAWPTPSSPSLSYMAIVVSGTHLGLCGLWHTL